MNFILSIPIEIRLAILFALGCCLGSLINLGIYRLAWQPRPISPWSRPAAEAPPRKVWDRLPVVGWVGLRREASLHGTGFWIRPMLIEILTGAVLAVLYAWEIENRGLVPDGLTMLNIVPNLVTLRHQQFLAHIVLFCFMLTAFWIDFDEMTIPDGVTIPCTLLGLVFVTLWPYVLLPASPVNCNGPFGVPMALPVWLTSPDEAPQFNPNAPPRFVMPWTRPDCIGLPALAAAIAGFWTWCLALAPGHWSTRHGYLRAMRVFTARMVRERATYGLMTLAAVGSLVIAGIWRQGGPHWAGLANQSWQWTRGRRRADADRSHSGIGRDGPRGDGLWRRDAAGHDRRVSRLAGIDRNLLHGAALCLADRLWPADTSGGKRDSLWPVPCPPRRGD